MREFVDTGGQTELLSALVKMPADIDFFPRTIPHRYSCKTRGSMDLAKVPAGVVVQPMTFTRVPRAGGSWWDMRECGSSSSRG